jgi:hypothetical protein
VATKKTSGTGPTRSRSKKAAATPEVTGTAASNPTTAPTGNPSTTSTSPSTTSTTPSTTSTNVGGTAVATAREKSAPTTTSTPAASNTGKPNFNHPSAAQERIRQRAYQLFEQRGGQHGFDIEDWLRAEAELSQR